MFDRLDPASYSQATSQTVYDDKGTPHTLSIFHKKVNSADLDLTRNSATGTTFSFGVDQSLGTTLNGEQTSKIATTATPSSVTGSTQTLSSTVMTYLSGGSESSNGIGSVTTVSGGSSYIDGIYKNVALTGVSSGASNAYGTVTVADGVVKSLVITSTGSGYTSNESVTGTFGDSYSISGSGVNLAATPPSIAITQGTTGTTEKGRVTFTDLAAGRTLTIAGVSFTAGTNGALASDVASVFANLAAGAAGNTSSYGTISGNLSGWTTGAVSSNSITFTSTSAATNVTDLSATVTGDGMLGSVYNLKLSDGTILTAKRKDLSINPSNGAAISTPKYTVEVDRYALFATLDTIPLGTTSTGTGTTAIKLSGSTNYEQTSIGTMAFVAGKNLDSLARDANNKPQFVTKLTLNATGGSGNTWGKTSNGGVLSFDLYGTETTGYSSSQQTYTSSQDGSPTAQLTAYSFDSYGKLVAQYDNGKSVVKGQLILATFNNFEGLVPVGGNGFQASAVSGDPLEDTPNGSQMGAIRAQAIEESNVDLTQQLVRLMVLQRAYSAASQATKVQVATLVDDTLRIGQ